MSNDLPHEGLQLDAASHPSGEGATPARVGLRRTGAAISTVDHLRFQLDHAQARDAVHTTLDVAMLLEGLRRRQRSGIVLASAACSASGNVERQTYLRRPDLGRRLRHDSMISLAENPREGAEAVECVFVIADGLSALAVERHALPLLDAIWALLPPARGPVAPVCVVTGARVALGDEIGGILQAALAVVLIGERPGLSAADSLSVYLTWSPRLGRTDAERNCISNVRREGTSYGEAAERTVSYMNEAKRLRLTGTALKENRSHLSGSRGASGLSR